MPVAVLVHNALVALAARSLRVRAQGGGEGVTLWWGGRRRGGSEECELACRISLVEACARELQLRAIQKYSASSQVCGALIQP